MLTGRWTLQAGLPKKCWTPAAGMEVRPAGCSWRSYGEKRVVLGDTPGRRRGAEAEGTPAPAKPTATALHEERLVRSECRVPKETQRSAAESLGVTSTDAAGTLCLPSVDCSRTGTATGLICGRLTRRVWETFRLRCTQLVPCGPRWRSCPQAGGSKLRGHCRSRRVAGLPCGGHCVCTGWRRGVASPA